MNTPNAAAIAARALFAAWQHGPKVHSAALGLADRAGAYAVQDATLLHLGPVGGWKVGAKSAEAEPICAPLPHARLMPSGSQLAGKAWQLRGMEVEVALRLGRDLSADGPHTPLPTLLASIDAVLPAIEVVETRLSDWQQGAPPSTAAPSAQTTQLAQIAQLADLQSHGALILGAPVCLSLDQLAQFDLRQVQAELRFNGQRVAHTHGGNPSAELWRLLRWLAWQCTQRGQPLRAGQVITTGSCTGMVFAPAGACVEGTLVGLGTVALQLA
jgi:2-keto-4-pentenoate hydratase